MDVQIVVERKSDLLPAVEPLCDTLVQVYSTDRYPGFDLDDPDWPKLRAQVEGVTALLETVKARLPAQACSALAPPPPTARKPA